MGQTAFQIDTSAVRISKIFTMLSKYISEQPTGWRQIYSFAQIENRVELRHLEKLSNFAPILFPYTTMSSVNREHIHSKLNSPATAILSHSSRHLPFLFSSSASYQRLFQDMVSRERKDSNF